VAKEKKNKKNTYNKKLAIGHTICDKKQKTNNFTNDITNFTTLEFDFFAAMIHSRRRDSDFYETAGEKNSMMIIDLRNADGFTNLLRRLEG
jgi:hypothetical protein